jgi:hypothetical protein
MALKNGFDPVKAMSSTIKDPEKRAKQIEKKLSNPEKALEQAEKNIVYGRLVNYMRRSRWKYHPDQRGGRSVSLDSILYSLNINEDSDENMNLFSVEDKVHFNQSQADIDRIELMKALEDGKDVRSVFLSLTEERREDVLEMLSNSSMRIESVDFDENDFIVSVPEGNESDEIIEEV